MKCYTVTENGVIPGIKFLREPYPHVAVGDPKLSSNDYRRVEVDASLASGADATVMECSYTLDMKTEGRRRASYKLIPATGADGDQALVKLEAHCTALRPASALSTICRSTASRSRMAGTSRTAPVRRPGRR